MGHTECEYTGCKLLVIDDDASVRDSIVTCLVESGFEVKQAESGEQGLEVFAAESPDLVLCDLRMPGLDGLEVLRQIRSREQDTPFIVISGGGVITDVVEALRLGASDYISKPVIDPEILEYAIRRALDNAELVRQNRHFRESLEEAIVSLQESLTVLQEDQKAGRQIQKKMLPASPFQFHNYHIDYHIWPSLYLSGDFVDYFPVDDRYFGFYLADVSGHGSSSAFITVLLKHVSMSLLDNFRTKTVESADGETHILSPSLILSTINKTLLNSGLGKHVTVFCGIVDTQAGELIYSTGGHFPFPILAMEGETRPIETRGLPVGLLADVDYADERIDLSGTFTLTIFSDGILEILPQSSVREKEQLLLSAVDPQADSVQAVTSRLKIAPLRNAPDDIALLVLSGKV